MNMIGDNVLQASVAADCLLSTFYLLLSPAKIFRKSKKIMSAITTQEELSKLN